MGKIFSKMNGGQTATASFENISRDCAEYHSRKDIDTEVSSVKGEQVF